MTNLVQELSRLFFLPDQEKTLSELVSASLLGEGCALLPLLGKEQRVRAFVVDVARASDWNAVSALYQGIQGDLDLPAPAIAVCPKAGFQVWFSLMEPVPAAQAEEFLDALRMKYLADIPLGKVSLHPAAGNSNAEVSLVPSCHGTSGRWSAFIDPTLGGMFADEPGLEIAPNLDRQADMLAGIKSINAGDFQRVLAQLLGERESGNSLPFQLGTTLNVGTGFTDPKSFLLAVMNDPSASARDRIRAAKALLPYFEKARHP